jgi:hypothetical protein
MHPAALVEVLIEVSTNATGCLNTASSGEPFNILLYSTLSVADIMLALDDTGTVVSE